MADSFNKKDREKKKQKRKKEKAERKLQRKAEGIKGAEFMYLDEDGNLSLTPPDPTKKKPIIAENINVSTPKKTDTDDMGFTREGVVKFFNTEKGYGFILDKLTGESYFVHIENIKEPIKDNDKVLFDVGSGPKGKIALNVKLN